MKPEVLGLPKATIIKLTQNGEHIQQIADIRRFTTTSNESEIQSPEKTAICRRNCVTIGTGIIEPCGGKGQSTLTEDKRHS